MCAGVTIVEGESCFFLFFFESLYGRQTHHSGKNLPEMQNFEVLVPFARASL